jgi:hypothetical protein
MCLWIIHNSQMHHAILFTIGRTSFQKCKLLSTSVNRESGLHAWLTNTVLHPLLSSDSKPGAGINNRDNEVSLNLLHPSLSLNSLMLNHVTMFLLVVLYYDDTPETLAKQWQPMMCDHHFTTHQCKLEHKPPHLLSTTYGTTLTLTIMGRVPLPYIVLLEDLDATFTCSVLHAKDKEKNKHKKFRNKENLLNVNTLMLSGNALDGVAAPEGRILFVYVLRSQVTTWC